MSALTLKLNKSVKFIIALGVFALIVFLSSHTVKADTYYPSYFRGNSEGYLVGSSYTFVPHNCTEDYLQYYVFAQYPYFVTVYEVGDNSQLNLLINFNSISSGGTFSFAYLDSSSSFCSVTLKKGDRLSFTDYSGNIFYVFCVGDTLAINAFSSSSPSSK